MDSIHNIIILTLSLGIVFDIMIAFDSFETGMYTFFVMSLTLGILKGIYLVLYLRENKEAIVDKST